MSKIKIVRKFLLDKSDVPAGHTMEELVMAKVAWDESKHPRGEAGEFGSGKGGRARDVAARARIAQMGEGIERGAEGKTEEEQRAGEEKSRADRLKESQRAGAAEQAADKRPRMKMPVVGREKAAYTRFIGLNEKYNEDPESVTPSEHREIAAYYRTESEERKIPRIKAISANTAEFHEAEAKRKEGYKPVGPRHESDNDLRFKELKAKHFHTPEKVTAAEHGELAAFGRARAKRVEGGKKRQEQEYGRINTSFAEFHERKAKDKGYSESKYEVPEKPSYDKPVGR